MSGSAKVDVFVDNERVRVQRFTLPPGGDTGWHVHGTDYVIVPYSDGRLRVDTKTGPIEVTMKKDEPYFRQKGVEHNVISLEPEPFAFLEIEIK